MNNLFNFTISIIIFSTFGTSKCQEYSSNRFRLIYLDTLTFRQHNVLLFQNDFNENYFFLSKKDSSVDQLIDHEYTALSMDSVYHLKYVKLENRRIPFDIRIQTPISIMYGDTFFTIDDTTVAEIYESPDLKDIYVKTSKLDSN